MEFQQRRQRRTEPRDRSRGYERESRSVPDSVDGIHHHGEERGRQVRVRVRHGHSASTAPRRPPPPPRRTPPLEEKFEQSNIVDALFDYDKSDIRPDAAEALRGNATALQSLLEEYPAAAFLIEGHCDERGTTEYNLALGDSRADAAMQFLVNLGVPASKLSKVSLGEERPVCSEESEACYQRNRRAHIALR